MRREACTQDDATDCDGCEPMNLTPATLLSKVKLRVLHSLDQRTVLHSLQECNSSSPTGSGASTATSRSPTVSTVFKWIRRSESVTEEQVMRMISSSPRSSAQIGECQSLPMRHRQQALQAALHSLLLRISRYRCHRNQPGVHPALPRSPSRQLCGPQLQPKNMLAFLHSFPSVTRCLENNLNL